MSEELDHGDAKQEATPGAQRQIDALDNRLHRGLRSMRVVVVLILAGFAFTGWQIDAAFDSQDKERAARINASASINTFLCQRIDSVGNGVAALVRVSLKNSPPVDQLEPAQRLGFYRFLRYAEAQEQPPRCKELALKIATLTGADPADVEITPIHLNDKADGAGG